MSLMNVLVPVFAPFWPANRQSLLHRSAPKALMCAVWHCVVRRSGVGYRHRSGPIQEPRQDEHQRWLSLLPPWFPLAACVATNGMDSLRGKGCGVWPLCLLQGLKDKCEVLVWTAASKDYCADVLSAIDMSGVEFCVCRRSPYSAHDRTTTREFLRAARQARGNPEVFHGCVCLERS